MLSLKIPTDNNCEITTMKDHLEDSKIAARIEPSLLNPFLLIIALSSANLNILGFDYLLEEKL